MPIAHRAVLEASGVAAQRGDDAVLALVLETEGSTYVRAGAIALFGGAAGQVGWLSGGCLEPEIAARAAAAAEGGRIEWLELDTRDDADLLAGSALGCRGQLRLALLPLRALPGWGALIGQWIQQSSSLILTLDQSGGLRVQSNAVVREWRVPASPCPWSRNRPDWDIPFAAPARIAVFGAGPETAVLLPLLRALDWKTVLIERRVRWLVSANLADLALAQPAEVALQHDEVRAAKAALVMHHHFEFDREALDALAGSPIAFIGLLGPRRRREDLFKLLSTDARDALQPRLHSPVGMRLGGEGPAAIALSIAAQLQAHRHGERDE